MYDQVNIYFWSAWKNIVGITISFVLQQHYPQHCFDIDQKKHKVITCPQASDLIKEITGTY